MEFRVLGPLEVVDEGGAAVALGGPRQRLVLAFLILDANRVVGADELIDRIWGDDPPTAARGTLFAYVSRLRKTLGPSRIEARAPGYILRAERSEIDLLRFWDLVDAARTEPDRTVASARLSEALALWRGEALSDLADHEGIGGARVRLEELRLAALEDLLDTDLALARHREVIPTLEALVADYPLRERVWGQLMLALYRSGRQGDALAAFHRARSLLVEELGIDPSPGLQELHERVLAQDPALDLPARPAISAAISGPRAADPTRTTSSEQAAGTPLSGWSAGIPARARPLASAALFTSVAVVAAVVASSWTGSTAAPPGTWTIGVDLPLSGEAATLGRPVMQGIQMAVDDLTAAGTPTGEKLRIVAFDDAADRELAAANARTIVDDATAIAMVGPWGSAETFPVIPITNGARLLQCGPSSTHPGLTKPRYGALDLRSAHPDIVTFVRIAPSDDIQSVALAAFAYDDLAAHRALVVDDTGDGRAIADAFEAGFTELGGTTVRRALNPDAAPRSVLAPFADELDAPRVVFFGGDPTRGAALRVAMAEAGRLSTPFLSWDALLYPSPGDPSYLQLVGAAAAAGSYVAHASLPDQKFSWADAYRRRFGSQPDEYAAAGYACVEIVAEALGAALAAGTGGDVRESVRAYVVDPTHRYETVLGTVAFDQNGDAIRQFVTFYRVDPSGAGGAGEWVIAKKQDFGPAP